MNAVPDKMLAWPLFGAGFENFGKDDKPCEIPVPEIGDDELLVRIDAIGLCFSDVKLIRAGEEHPRVISENLSDNPVIPGHEAVMTVMKVGDKEKARFSPGQRFIIQADIFVNGKGFAYGYAIDGGMAQYSRIDQRVLNGDEGCYLLPIADDTPAGIAALIEPWTCVIASYMIEHRETPLKGGKTLVAAGTGGAAGFSPGKLLAENNPAEIALLDIAPEFEKELRAACPDSKFEILSEDSDAEFDDIFLCGIENPDKAVELISRAARNAAINFVGTYPEGKLDIDVGAVHYQGWFLQGATSNNLSDAYGRNVRTKLKPGGVCWLPGGAGAMGQMHTQLAVEDENGPVRILVSDLDDERIANVEKLLGETVRKRGIEFKTLNPKNFASPEEFNKAVADFAPEGFDDIVMLVPVPAILEDAATILGTDGLMNIFAGIPAGKTAKLDISGIVEKGHRFIGSSGSLTEQLRYTLNLVETGKIDPVSALAAVGGMMDLKKGLEGVANAKFPGKTVIFPQLLDMPLTPIEKLGELHPKIAAALEKSGGIYSMEVENALARVFGEKD